MNTSFDLRLYYGIINEADTEVEENVGSVMEHYVE